MPLEIIEERTVAQAWGQTHSCRKNSKYLWPSCSDRFYGLGLWAFWYNGCRGTGFEPYFNCGCIIHIYKPPNSSRDRRDVLTIGMAVDANVLVFERIREEVRSGRTPISAVDSGYQRAFSTIIDANLTTLLRLSCCTFRIGSRERLRRDAWYWDLHLDVLSNNGD